MSVNLLPLEEALPSDDDWQEVKKDQKIMLLLDDPRSLGLLP